MTQLPKSGRGFPYATDDEAFRDHADPGFPWIRVTHGAIPDIPHNAWVYYLQADGRRFKKQMYRVSWYFGPPTWRKPPHVRPIAYVIVTEDYDMSMLPSSPDHMTDQELIERLYDLLQRMPDKLEKYGRNTADDWEALWPHASARLNEGPNYKLGKRVLDNMKQIRDHKE